MTKFKGFGKAPKGKNSTATTSEAFTLALEHYQAGRLAQAEEMCRQILLQQPNHLEALHWLGSIAYQTGRLQEAAGYCQKALAVNPNNLETLCNLGSVLQEMGKLEEAIINFQKALALNPNYALAHHGLGATFIQQGKLEQAVTHLHSAIALNPDDAKAHCSLGVALWEQGLSQEAFSSYQKAIQLQPDIAEAHINQGCILLSIGDFCNGFAELEWRSLSKDWADPRPFSQPVWDGSHLQGKTILLHAEQGFGDTIQFIRYAPLVAARGGRVVVECPASLRGLLATVSTIDQLVVRGETLPQFQVHSPLMSLPRILGTTLETIPAQIPYLFPPASHDRKLETLPGTIKVGIVWASGYRKPNFLRDYQRRSCPLSRFAQLFSIPGISFFSLQVGQNAGDIAQLEGDRTLQDLSPHIKDFADTAAAIAQMDLVISVDTAVAHLAGALGKPVWVLLSLPHDWRWLLEREDSPWYPTMRLFRQSQPGDWDGVLEQVAQALRSFTQEVSEQSTALGVGSQDFPVAAVSAPVASPAPLFSQLTKQADTQTNHLQLSTATEEAFTTAFEHYQAGHLTQAEQMYRHPQQSEFEALYQLGVTACQNGRLEEAASYFQKAVELNPNGAEAHTSLGGVLQEMGELEEAVLSFQKALALNPNYAFAHHGLGFTLTQQEKIEQAVTHLRRAIALNPHDAKAYCNLGVALWEQGLFEEAISTCQKSIQLQPDIAEAHKNLGQLLLLMGDFSNGFAEFEWRWHSKDLGGPRPFSQPLWDGSNLEGKTILLHAEQGLGDTIQFIRYAPMVAARGGRVVVGCPASLRHLLATVSGIEQLVVPGEPLPEFQVHSPLMSLPRILGTTLETIPACVPYLFPSTNHDLRLETLPGTGLKVGIVWASGYKKHNRNFLRDYQRRSCSLSRYAQLLSIPEISFFSLQVGDNAADIAQLEGEYRLQDLSPHIKDFADTAALIAQMDLVISVDTAVAHLAGALGKPVWVLLPFPHDWRWLQKREDSPWYPTMRLFRQSQPGDWQGVLEQVAQALSRFCQEVTDQSTAPGVASQNFPVTAAVSYPVASPTPLPSQITKLADTEINNLQLPTATEAALAIALDHYQAGRLALSEQMYRQILLQHPEQLEALHWLGNIAYQTGRFEEAAGYCQKALALNPNNAGLLTNLGGVLQEMGKLEEAILNFQKALTLDPNYALAHHCLGFTLIQQGNLEQAATHLRRAIALNPDDAKAYDNLGVALWEQGLLEEAISSYQKAIQIQPDIPETHVNLSFILLLLGDFRNGFAELEWYWQSKDRENRLLFSQPLWDGSHLEGKTILLHTEQGFGDTIQFIRYAPMVAARGGRVVVECPASLKRLLATVSGIEQLVVQGEALPAFQVHSGLMSLPRILGTTLETIPACVPYLFPPASHDLQLETHPGTRLKVGIVWASGYKKENINFLREYQRRSCPLSQYARLLSIPGISFYSLQVGQNAADIAQLEGERTLQDLSPYIKDFADTAALIAQMDLVISVDTAAAHLAGALGKPVWVLLSHPHDWRWLQKREDSPWYPTMRLFRQSQPGDWEGVLARVAQALRRFCQEVSEQSTPPGVGSQNFPVAAAVSPSVTKATPLVSQLTKLANTQTKNLQLPIATEEAFTIALEHYQAGRLALSEQIYRQILQEQPKQLEALHWLGIIAHQSGRPEEAAGYFQKVLALHPNNAGVLTNLASVLQEMGKLEEAILNLHKALALEPNYAFAHYGLGFTLTQQGKLDQAVTYLRRAIALSPHDAKAYCSLGVALHEQGLLEEALSSYQKSIQLQPDIAEAHNNLGQILLLSGDLRNGFAEYEWRWQLKDWGGPRPFQEPLWDGSNLEGKTILIHAEQGFGDTIQFIRYAPMVAARGGRVVGECPEPLRRLLATVSGIEQLVVPGEPLPQFQVHSPLMSLPYILGTTLETIPAQIPYLFPPARHDLRLETLPGTGLKVGIVWASGYKKHNRNFLRDYQRRSCPLPRYARLLSIPGIRFFSLQVGHNAADIAQLEGEYRLQDLSPHIKDFADTAALIAQMDLVISVDTAVAHLAGAMGKPVWVLLSLPHDWRWLLERKDSPWYPTMRLFRQSQPGDWDGVLEQVAQALRSFTEQVSEQSTALGVESQNYNDTHTNNLQLPIATSQAFTTELKHYPARQSGLSEQMNRQILEQSQFEALHHLGVTAYQLGNLEEATAYFQKALALNPHNVQAHNNLSVVLIEQGQLASAATHLRQVIALDANDSMAHTNLGNVLREQGELKEAILHLQIALALNPNNAFAYNGLGITLGNQGQWEEATTNFRQAVALNPDYADAHNNLGLVLQEQGKLEEAGVHYQQAIALQPDNPIAYTNLGNLLHEQGKLEEAILNFQKALALNPNDVDARNSLDMALQEQGKLRADL